MALTITVAAGADSSPACNKAMTYYATIANSDVDPVVLNSCSVSSPTPGMLIEQPNFLTSVGAVGVYNPQIPGSGSLAVRFSVVFQDPNMSGPSPQSPASPTNAINQPALPSGAGYYQLFVQAQATDDDAATILGFGMLGQGVLSQAQNVPRAEGGALDFRQGSNILGMFPGWP